MDWIQFALFFIGVFGLFIWNRTESRNDQRQTDAKLEAIRSLMYAIIQESKDFHGKLERHDAEYKAHMMHLHERK
jgi:hypothetical protein